MKQYILNHPDDHDLDITQYVVKGISNISEIAFDIDKVTTPTAGDVVCDNTNGVFVSGQGFFNDETTNYVITISDEGLDLFVGILSDIEHVNNRATLKVASIINKIIQMNIPFDDNPYIFTGTPAAAVKDILENQAKLPGLFIDNIGFDQLDTAEQNRNIEIQINIPAAEKVSFSSLLQEIYKITGLYVFSQRGIIRGERIGAFSVESFDYFWDSSQIIAEKTKHRRPIIWQKTRFVVPGIGGPYARNMTDAFPIEGPSILASFKEKTIESDGLGGKIQHSTETSAIECMNDLLGWRGFVRHEYTFNIDVINPFNKAALEAVPLLSKNKFESINEIVNGVLIEKKLFEDRAELKILTIVDPISKHPALREYPEVKNTYSTGIITGKEFNIEYMIEGGAIVVDKLTKVIKSIIFDNPAQKNIFVRSKKLYENNFSQWVMLEHEQVSDFIMGVHPIGHTI